MDKLKLWKVMSENVEEDLHQFDVKLKFLTFRGTLLFINVQPIILGLLRQEWMNFSLSNWFNFILIAKMTSEIIWGIHRHRLQIGQPHISFIQWKGLRLSIHWCWKTIDSSQSNADCWNAYYCNHSSMDVYLQQ